MLAPRTGGSTCDASLDAHYSHVCFGIVPSHRLAPLRLTCRRFLDELGLPPDLGLHPSCSNNLIPGHWPMRASRSFQTGHAFLAPTCDSLDRPSGHVCSPFLPFPPLFYLYSQADAIVTADAKTKTRHVRQRQLRSLSGWRSGLNRVCTVGNSLIFPIPLPYFPKFDAGKPGSEYMGSKSWLAPHVDRLLGDVAVLHSPFFGSGRLEYYLATRRPALEVRGVDAFEPVANLHRCYLRQDPVFLRSLLRLAGRKVDRRFYISHLLPGTQRGRAGRRAAYSYVLLRIGKVGLLHTAAPAGAEQRAALCSGHRAM